ncbi:response regulator [Spirosoma gilvum]
MTNAKNSQLSQNPGAKLLIIEPLDQQWTFIQQAISQGFKQGSPQRAESPQQTLTLLTSWQQQEWELPKLILLDLHLPSLDDGWQLLTAIKALSAPTRWIPIIVLSASNQRADISKAYELGGASFVSKPIDLAGWQILFEELRAYWWETVRLPPPTMRCN